MRENRIQILPYAACVLIFMLCASLLPTAEVDAVNAENVVVGITTTTQLETPTGVHWDESEKFLARWDAVEGADSYTVVLYDDGSIQGYVETTETSYSWKAGITDSFGSGTYTFTVIATSEDESYTSSDESEMSDEFKYWQMPEISSTAWKVIIIVVVVGVCILIAAWPDKNRKKREKIVHKK
ncbi:MAG: hypothetical protein LUG88_08620 [Clostridia bacterium]|nr:hypothetical protein [Clostridia bacterium]